MLEDPDSLKLAARVRENTIAVLRTFASAAEQRAYGAEVSSVNVPGELFCQWADDMYHPDTAAFILAFSPAERCALSEFDARFRRVSAAHSGRMPGLEEWLSSVAGADLATYAAAALRALGRTCPI
jgi:hypothetical protein